MRDESWILSAIHSRYLAHETDERLRKSEQFYQRYVHLSRLIADIICHIAAPLSARRFEFQENKKAHFSAVNLFITHVTVVHLR